MKDLTVNTACMHWKPNKDSGLAKLYHLHCAGFLKILTIRKAQIAKWIWSVTTELFK